MSEKQENPGSGAMKKHLKSSKAKSSRPAKLSTRMFKVVIRKLPSRDYNQDMFLQDIDRVRENLKIEKEKLDFLHFFEGKIR